ncbi:hypothetical protein [Streptomyces hirsutus]|uniref:hypothetical protein n=1 Tax=Streptomyces hirsutus TaxID=35620 RepID=UPI0006E3C456|nr:hypothetical protein [Streptomyces hirsutus]
MSLETNAEEAPARDPVAEQFELLPDGAESELRALQRAIDLTHRTACAPAPGCRPASGSA